jgi:hypothetical protein
VAQDDVLFVTGDKVGVGTATPTVTLHVVADGAEIKVEDTSVSPGSRTLFAISNLGRTAFTVENRSAPSGNGLWYFLVSNAGRFAIGRAGSGTDEFQVTPSGDVIITGSLTTGGGFYPDYVFDPEYTLMPLSELEEFIREHRHLPNVASATETGDGARVNMSELQLRLLEKVEELTLYTLQQERTIARQERLLADLEARLSALESEGSERPAAAR